MFVDDTGKSIFSDCRCDTALLYQERKRHINLRKIPGTPAGCPWDTRRDKQGSTGRCPRDFLLFTIEKGTEKGIFAGTPAGCPRDTRPSRGFSEILCDFFLCAFSAPYYSAMCPSAGKVFLRTGASWRALKKKTFSSPPPWSM